MAKKTELAAIQELEKAIGKKLPVLGEFKDFEVGYIIDEKCQIIALSLAKFNISDISFLQNFPNLKKVNLFGTRINDISVLKKLSKLEVIEVSRTQISDISILETLPQLTQLNIWGTKVSDFSVLEKLHKLTDLDLGNTSITDISILESLPKLTRLRLWQTKVSDFSAMAKLHDLTDLFLSENFDLKIELPALQEQFENLKDLLANITPELKEKINEIGDSLDEITPGTEKSKLGKPLNKLKRFLDKLGDEKSDYHKIIKGTQKGIEYAQKLGKTYNKFAQWLALPQVPDIFLK